MQVGFLVCFLWFWPWQENSFVLRNIVLPLSHRSEPPSSKIVMRKEPGMLFSRKPTSLEGLSWSKATVFQFPYQEPCAKPDLVLHASTIVWNSTMISFTLATILGRALRHLLLLQFQVITVAFRQKVTRCEHQNGSMKHSKPWSNYLLGNFLGEVKPKCTSAPQQLDHIVTWRVLDSVLQPLQLCPKAARVFQG